MKKESKVVFAKCRRGSDLATSGQTCTSTSVQKLSADGSPVPMFKCSKCGFVWGVAVGGTFNI